MTVMASRLYELLRREGSDLFEGGHAVHTPRPLVEEILGQISLENKTILVMFNMEFAISLVYTKMVDPAAITVYIDHPNKVALAKRLGVKYITNLDIDMKFDVVIGNPPYQDGSKEGGQNKIYNMFAKSGLNLLSPTGTLAFVTPTSVLKNSKRFSLVNQPGLKLVDFRADNYFKVGINICWWLVDKSYSGLVTVKHDAGEEQQSNKTVIYDYSKVDKNFAKLYTALKRVTDTPEKRMFNENNFGEAVIKQKKSTHQYVLYSVFEKNKTVFGYSRRKPFFYGKKKIVIPMTKTVTDNSILVDVDDFYVAYLCTEVDNEIQIENIKSFILSKYFSDHSAKWRDLDGYGFNYALKYLPPFDKNKKWSNEEVKTFLESFLDA